MLAPAKPTDMSLQRYKLRSGKKSSNSILASPVNYKISSPVAGPDSGLFLYLDLHGHTTKRGSNSDLCKINFIGHSQSTF